MNLRSIPRRAMARSRVLVPIVVLLARYSYGSVVACALNPGAGAFIADVRADIATQCPCDGGSRAQYLRCAKTVIKTAVSDGRLPPRCRGVVTKGVTHSTCGRPGAVTCCDPRPGRCAVKVSDAACAALSSTGWSAGTTASCYDACGPVCGNRIVEAGEQCDDGNQLDGDGCTSACQLELAPGCTAVSPAEYLAAYGDDALFQKLLARAGDLGFATDLLYPRRCTLADGTIAYNATLARADSSDVLSLRSRGDISDPFGTIVVRTISSTEAQIMFGSWTAVVSDVGTAGGPTVMLTDETGQPVTPVLHNPPLPSGCDAPSDLCSKVSTDFADCLIDGIGTLLSPSCADCVTCELTCDAFELPRPVCDVVCDPYCDACTSPPSCRDDWPGGRQCRGVNCMHGFCVPGYRTADPWRCYESQTNPMSCCQGCETCTGGTCQPLDMSGVSPFPVRATVTNSTTCIAGGVLCPDCCAIGNVGIQYSNCAGNGLGQCSESVSTCVCIPEAYCGIVGCSADDNLREAWDRARNPDYCSAIPGGIQQTYFPGVNGPLPNGTVVWFIPSEQQLCCRQP